MIKEETGFGDLHWEEINDSIAPKDKKIDYESGDDSIKLKNLYDSQIHKYKDETYEIIDKAKQQKRSLEKVANITLNWDTQYSFVFKKYKDRTIKLFAGVGEISENLTNDQNEITGLQTKKFMIPFMDKIDALNTMFNNLENTIKKWTKVQTLWSALEPVFFAEDIKKQLPQEAAKFRNLDKDFQKNMALASDIKLVKLCCENDVIVSRLPDLEKQLYECQRKLDR
jgi:dynein heavy chain